MLRITSVHAIRCRLPFITLMLLVAGSAAGAGEPPGKNWHQDWTSAWKDSQTRGRPILFFVTMEHCHYCDKMCRETYRDDKVLEQLEREFVLASIDSDRYPNLVRKLNVEMFPTTVIVSPDARVIDSMSGYVGPERLRVRLQAAGAKIARR